LQIRTFDSEIEILSREMYGGILHAEFKAMIKKGEGGDEQGGYGRLHG